VTTFTYDPLGRPATGKDNAGNTTNYAYDALSRLTQVTWPDATHRNYAYDNLDALTGLTDERGKLWSYVYDANERLMTETDPLSEATGFLYDALDRMTQAVDPLSHATLYGYDGDGRVMSMTDRSGRMTSYQYDALSRLTGVMDPAGGADQFAYDADSRMISEQDPLGHSSSFMYDMLDRVTRVTDPVGTGFDYGYDTMGRLHTATGPLGHVETFNYDPRGLLSSFLNGTLETDFPRTALGEVSQVTDPNRNSWPRAYDPQGRMTSSADPLARGTTYEYDALSRVIHIGRSDGTVQQISRDAAGRVTGEDYSDGTNYVVTWSDANRITGATGASFAYDAAGRMINSNGFTFTYDPEGRVLSETLAPGKVVSYSYDSRGLPSQMMDWMGGTTSFTYDAARRLTGITRPNGTSASYQYDAADRLIQSVEKPPNPTDPPLALITLTRDALGQPTSIARRQPLMPGQTMASSSAFTYDPASQLNGVGHDPLGRMTGDATRTFQWDGASRLTHYVAGADSPSYAYDAFGQQLTSTQGSQGVAQAWNYGRGYPTNDDMAVNLPTPRTSYNVRAPSGLLLYGVNGSSGARSFYHYDEGGNTAFLTNDGGSVVTEYAYTPFGGVAALGETADNAFTYGGAQGASQLGGSGLFRMGGGIYDAMTMRGISGNTIASGPVAFPPEGGDPHGPRTGSYHWERQPGQIGSPGSWVEKQPGPAQSLDGAMIGGIHTIDALTGTYQAVLAALGDRVPVSTPEWTDLTGSDPGPINSPGSWVEKSPGPNQPSGVSEIYGNDAIVTLGGRPDAFGKVKTDGNHIGGGSFGGAYSNNKNQEEAGTLMHELGHMFGLDHGSGKPPRPYSRYLYIGHGRILSTVDLNEDGSIEGGGGTLQPARNPWEFSEPGMKRSGDPGTTAFPLPWRPVFSPGSPWGVFHNDVFRCLWCPDPDSGEPANDINDVNR
jgi:YD repeat-containing protein